jgi:hypothetical protein
MGTIFNLLVVPKTKPDAPFRALELARSLMQEKLVDGQPACWLPSEEDLRFGPQHASGERWDDLRKRHKREGQTAAKLHSIVKAADKRERGGLPRSLKGRRENIVILFDSLNPANPDLQRDFPLAYQTWLFECAVGIYVVPEGYRLRAYCEGEEGPIFDRVAPEWLQIEGKAGVVIDDFTGSHLESVIRGVWPKFEAVGEIIP